MQRLVSPELKVYTISDREALSELVAGLRLDSTLASNIREVLGLQTVGNANGGRQPGRQHQQQMPDGRELTAAAAASSLPSGPLTATIQPVLCHYQAPLFTATIATS